MAQKYAVYKLKKVKGENAYEVSSYAVFNNLSSAYHDLECWDEDLDGPQWYNAKIGEFVAFEKHDKMIYIPNWKIRKNRYGNDEWKLLGPHGHFPIYYIDKYPNHLSYYKPRIVKDGIGEDTLVLEGIE